MVLRLWYLSSAGALVVVRFGTIFFEKEVVQLENESEFLRSWYVVHREEEWEYENVAIELLCHLRRPRLIFCPM